MKSRMASFAMGITLLASAVHSGCGKKSDENLPRTYPVTGVVMYKGNPIAEAQVTFYPQGQGNPGTGRTEDNGRFVLTTYDARDGAVPGIHVVTVELFPMGGLPGMEVETTGATPIPKKYASSTTSDLTAEVKPDTSNNITLELKD